MTSKNSDFTDWRWFIQALRPNQRRVLDQVALGNDGGHHPATLKALESRGLIAGEPQTLGGRFPVTITRYYMPIHVHIAWCALCSEEVEAAGGIEVVEAEMRKVNE